MEGLNLGVVIVRGLDTLVTYVILNLIVVIVIGLDTLVIVILDLIVVIVIGLDTLMKHLILCIVSHPKICM